MARSTFDIAPRLLPAGETISPTVSLNKVFTNVVAIMDVPTPDASLQFTLTFEVTVDGTHWTQLFATSGNTPMLDQNGNILPFYQWTFALSGPGGVIPFARQNDYRMRITLNKPATLGFRIGGDS